jgi:Domain of unknown function (DUF4926)
MSKFAMYQTVRVVSVPAASKAWPRSGLPQIGDTGAVIEIYCEPHEAYTVESVASDGRTNWLVDFLPNELETV